MLSVFRTPWTNPTRIQCTTSSAVRSHTSANMAASFVSKVAPAVSRWGKSARMVNSASRRERVVLAA